VRLGPIEVDSVQLRALCAKWQIVRLGAFGSVLRSDFHEGSDVDLLVDFAPDAKPSLFDLYEAEVEFALLFGRPVELVSRKGLLASSNWIRKDEILDTAVDLFAA